MKQTEIDFIKPTNINECLVSTGCSRCYYFVPGTPSIACKKYIEFRNQEFMDSYNKVRQRVNEFIRRSK